jgi:hypothetical protein
MQTGCVEQERKEGPEATMNFRLVVLIALWTVLAGPIFARPIYPNRPESRAVDMPRKAPVGKAP